MTTMTKSYNKLKHQVKSNKYYVFCSPPKAFQVEEQQQWPEVRRWQDGRQCDVSRPPTFPHQPSEQFESGPQQPRGLRQPGLCLGPRRNHHSVQLSPHRVLCTKVSGQQSYTWRTGFIFVQKGKSVAFSQAHSHALINATRRHEYSHRD